MTSIIFFSKYVKTLFKSHGCSSVNLMDIFKTPFPEIISRGLLLYMQTSPKKITFNIVG